MARLDDLSRQSASLKCLKELRERHIQGTGHARKRLKTEAALPSFHVPDVVPVQAQAMSESLLREALRRTQLPHPAANGQSKFLRHARIVTTPGSAVYPLIVSHTVSVYTGDVKRATRLQDRGGSSGSTCRHGRAFQPIRADSGLPDTRTDGELVREMHLRNDDAIETLLLRYRRLIYHVAAGILRDPTEAEDVTQEVFFEIYTKANQYDPSRGSVKVWLLQFAYHRSLTRKSALQRCAIYQQAPVDLPEVRRLGSAALSPEESRWLVGSGLNRLPMKQRVTITLVCLEGKTLREVADQLGVSWGCARHYYYRGLTALRTWLRDDDHKGGAGTAADRAFKTSVPV